MTTACPRIPKCPLFNNEIEVGKEKLESYKNIYCNNGESEFVKCKRYLVRDAVMKCAEFIMPDSPETADDLIERMVEEGII